MMSFLTSFYCQVGGVKNSLGNCPGNEKNQIIHKQSTWLTVQKNAANNNNIPWYSQSNHYQGQEAVMTDSIELIGSIQKATKNISFHIVVSITLV